MASIFNFFSALHQTATKKILMEMLFHRGLNVNRTEQIPEVEEFTTQAQSANDYRVKFV